MYSLIQLSSRAIQTCNRLRTLLVLSMCLAMPLTGFAQTLKKVTITPASVVGGASATGTVTLSARAGTGGKVVTLTASNTSASVSESVNVPSGALTASFTVSTAAVPANITATIKGVLGTSSASATLAITAPKLKSLSFNPNSVEGGSQSTGTIVMSSPAPAAGLTVTLTSSEVAWGGPSTTTISGGASTGTFTFATHPVTSNRVVKVTAKLNGATTVGTLTIKAPLLTSLMLDPSTVSGGSTSGATVTLSGPAPTGGLKITIQNTSPSANAPKTVTVAAGATSVDFVISTTSVTKQTTSKITALQGSAKSTATLTIVPLGFSSLTFDPSTVTATGTSTGTVKLNGMAPATGLVVKLVSNQAAVIVPANVTISGGASSATFTATTQAVPSSLTAYITAGFGTNSTTATLTINPILLVGLSLSPTAVVGGTTSLGTVTLNTSAPSGGLVIALTSNQATATVPPTITVPAGASGASFTISTVAVPTQVSAAITAGISGSNLSVNLTVNPPAVTGLTLDPTTVIGGASSTGTVMIGTPAPAGGFVVNLSSSQVAATVPSSVTVTSGTTSATFAISTINVASQSLPKITGSSATSSANATLTVNPIGLTAVTLNPTSVVGGTSSTGTVTINAPAPSGGTIVSLTSSLNSATVPSTLTVPAGSTSANFTVQTQAVASVQTPKITATLNGSTISANLTVNPPSLVSLKFNPSSLASGTNSTGTLTLSSAAPVGGFSIALSSEQASVVPPASVSIAAGSTTATFIATTKVVAVSTVVTVTATDPNGVAVTGKLTIGPPPAQTVSIPVTDIAFDPISGKIWAAISSTGGTYANCVVAIDPSDGSIGKSINIGATPGHIAITDDGQFAYVNIPNDGSIRRADLNSGATKAFAIGVGNVFDLEAVPGSPHAFVVVVDPIGGVNVSVWDDGVRRAGTGAGGSAIKFAGSSSLMYGDGGDSLFVDTLDSMAINWTQQIPLPVSGLQWANNLIYTNTPSVIDPIQKIVVESLPTTNFLTDRGVAVNSAENRIYYITWDASHNKRILDFDMTTYQEYPYIDCGLIPGGAKHIISCGNHTVAYYIFGSGVTQNLIIVRNLP